jgi:hypothetical protein
MRRLTTCALVLAALSVLILPAGASTSAHAPKFVGTYAVTIVTTGATDNWTVSADGTWTSSLPSPGTWRNKGAQIALVDFVSVTKFKFVGTKTAQGINSASNPGTLYIGGKPAGTWYAVKTS